MIKAASASLPADLEAGGAGLVVGNEISVSPGSILHKISASGKSIYLPDAFEFIGELLGERILPRRLAARLAAIAAPFELSGANSGVLYLQGEGLAEADLSCVEAFACHVAAALENASLFASLSESEEGLRELLEAFPDTIGIKDGAGRWVRANQAMQELFKLKEWITRVKATRTWPKLLPVFKHVFAVCAQSDELAWQKGALFRSEERLSQPDGAEKSFDIIKVPVFHPDGTRNRLLILGRDITERKAMEKDLLKRAEELSGLHSLSIDISSIQDLAELLHKVVERAVGLLGGSGGGLYDPRQRTVSLMVSLDPEQDFAGTVLAYGEGAAGLVAETGNALVIDDYRNWPGRAVVYEDQQPFTAVIAVPMTWQDQVIGVLDVIDDASTRLFTQSDLELLTLLPARLRWQSAISPAGSGTPPPARGRNARQGCRGGDIQPGSGPGIGVNSGSPGRGGAVRQRGGLSVGKQRAEDRCS